jgi:hypothetical protein
MGGELFSSLDVPRSRCRERWYPLGQVLQHSCFVGLVFSRVILSLFLSRSERNKALVEDQSAPLFRGALSDP